MSLSNSKLCQTLNCDISSFDDQLQWLKKQENNSVTNQVMLDVIPYGKHYIDEDDINSVVEVLRHGMLTQGPKILDDLFYLTRTWCFSVHRYRMKMLGRWNFQ